MSSPSAARVPRSLVVAEEWARLTGVEPLSNAAGQPLARTVKLLLDPLVIRPTRNPGLGSALVTEDAARELRERIAGAADDLRACAAWFLLLKRARRAARITEGNPQDLYFQRAFELARRHGAPAAEAHRIAADELSDIHDRPGRITAARLRAHLGDPDRSERLRGDIARAWEARAGGGGVVPEEALSALLDGCATGSAEEGFSALVAAEAGTASAGGLDEPGAARAAGLSDRDIVLPPEVGTTASKSAMPAPFDRSILERLFVGLERLDVAADGLEALVSEEVSRSAGGWQLAEEPGRVALLAGRDAAASLDGGPATDAGRRLSARWEREPFVRRALRLPDEAVRVADVRQAFLRRLWARVHGRELRGEGIAAAELWDVLDGAMRSLVLDRRDRVKADIARRGRDASADREAA